MALSAKLRNRYVPALPERPSPGLLTWILSHDWRIRDVDRRAIIAILYSQSHTDWPRTSCEREARRAVADLARYGSPALPIADGYGPCDDCGHMVRECGQCNACAYCTALNNANDAEEARADALADCGCCQDCCVTCETCDKCAGCGQCECQECAGRRCDRRVPSTCSACDRCAQCCECSTCSNCGEPQPEGTCGECNCGTSDGCNCCSCAYCSNCGETRRGEENCRECDRCESCCAASGECDGRAGALRGTCRAIHGDAPPRTAVPIRERRVNRGQGAMRLAGVEVEFNGCENFEPIREWAHKWGAGVHSDGSAGSTRGASGWECVTAPAAGDHLLNQLDELDAAFGAAGAVCNARCGVHVHIDARDLYWPEMLRLVTLWARIEPAMYLLGGQERVDTRNGGAYLSYCKPWGSELTDAIHGTTDPKGALLTAWWGSHSEGANGREHARILGRRRAQREKHCGDRYRSMNLAPWISRQEPGPAVTSRNRLDYFSKSHKIASDATVEFRLREATLDAGDLKPWAMLLQRIVSFAATSTDREVAHLPRSAMRALCKIAPDLKPWLLATLRTYRTRTTACDSTRNARVVRMIGYHPAHGYTLGHTGRYARERAEHEQPSLQFGELPRATPAQVDMINPVYTWRYLTVNVNGVAISPDDSTGTIGGE